MMISLIANKIATKLEWTCVDECKKCEMIEEVLNEFTGLMTEAIKIASEK